MRPKWTQAFDPGDTSVLRFLATQAIIRLFTRIGFKSIKSITQDDLIRYTYKARL